MALHWWGYSNRVVKVSFINGVDTVNWPLSRVSKADFSSVSSDKVLIFQTTAFETLYWLTKGGLGHCKIIIKLIVKKASLCPCMQE